MALDFQCSFDRINTAQLISGNARFHHAGASTISTATGVRTGAQCVNLGSNAELNKRLLPNQASRVIGFSYYMDPAGTIPSDHVIVGLVDGGSIGATTADANVQAGVAVASTG